MFEVLRADLRRNRDPLARLALTVFRLGQWTAARRTVTRRLTAIPYKAANLLVLRLGLHCDLPRTAKIGPGLWLPHPYGVIVHAKAIIGAHVTLYQRVTIGRRDLTGEPTIGDRVVIGAGANVVGPVTVGDGARIGAGAIIVDDVPAGATAVGPKARVLTGA